MAWFLKQKHDSGRLHYILRMAFERVKSDTQNLFEWINYFSEKHEEHDKRLAIIEQHLRQTPKIHHIKQIIDNYSPYNHILEKIESINSRISELEQKNIYSREVERKENLKERLIKKINKNSNMKIYREKFSNRFKQLFHRIYTI